MPVYNELTDLRYVPELQGIYIKKNKEIGNDWNEFDTWIKELIAQNKAEYKGEQDPILYIYGHPVLNAYQRWIRNGRKCPVCASKNYDLF